MSSCFKFINNRKICKARSDEIAGRRDGPFNAFFSARPTNWPLGKQHYSQDRPSTLVANIDLQIDRTFLFIALKLTAIVFKCIKFFKKIVQISDFINAQNLKCCRQLKSYYVNPIKDGVFLKKLFFKQMDT